MRAPRWLISLAAALLGLLLSTGVRAAGQSVDLCQSDPACRQHTKQAVRLYSEKNYQAALGEFETAYGLRPEPMLLLNIGRSLHRLGRPEEALDRYKQFEQAVPHPDEPTQQSLHRYVDEAKAEVTAKAAAQAQQAQQAQLVTAQPPPKEDKPLYKKWWFWTGGAVVVTALAVGLGVGLSQSGQQVAYTDFNWRLQ